MTAPGFRWRKSLWARAAVSCEDEGRAWRAGSPLCFSLPLPHACLRVRCILCTDLLVGSKLQTSLRQWVDPDFCPSAVLGGGERRELGGPAELGHASQEVESSLRGYHCEGARTSRDIKRPGALVGVQALEWGRAGGRGLRKPLRRASSPSPKHSAVSSTPELGCLPDSQ